MTETQHEMFIIIDEYWKAKGYGPSVDDLMRLSENKSRSNVVRICQVLVREKFCKRTPGLARSIRPAYINLREIP